MFKRLLPLFAIAACFAVGATNGMASASASPAHHHALFPVTVRDDTGHYVTIKKNPNRIISLDPRDTETLFALDLEKRVVADGGKEDEGAWCCKTRFKYPSQWPSPWGRNYPSRSRTLTHIEGGYDAAHPFDVELVESLHPGLVLSLNSDPAGIDQMRRLGLKVIVLDPHTMSQIIHDIELVGRVTGRIAKTKTVVDTIVKRLDAVETALAHVSKEPTVFYEIDDSTGSPYTACKGSFIDQMLSIAKAINVAHNVQPCPKANPYPQMQTEALVGANPKIILLGDSDYGVTKKQVEGRNGWRTISAVKHDHIYPVDDDLISRAGPREVIGLERVAKLLHPAAFKK